MSFCLMFLLLLNHISFIETTDSRKFTQLSATYGSYEIDSCNRKISIRKNRSIRPVQLPVYFYRYLYVLKLSMINSIIKFYRCALRIHGRSTSFA